MILTKIRRVYTKFIYEVFNSHVVMIALENLRVTSLGWFLFINYTGFIHYYERKKTELSRVF